MVQIPKPSIPEQSAIVTTLRDTDALIESLEKLIAKKHAIKQGAMRGLLTGKRRLPGFRSAWQLRSFGELFRFLSTANNPRADLSVGGDIGYIHYGDIHTSTSVLLDCASASSPSIALSKVANIPFIEEGDLVMVDASEDYAGIGKCAEIRRIGDRKIVAGLHTLLLRADKALLADGFKGYLQFIPSIRAALTTYATGVSVYGIAKSKVRGIEVALPLADEQIAIAAVLSDMDLDIKALETKLAKYRRIKQGMMQTLLTGRIRLLAN